MEVEDGNNFMRENPESLEVAVEAAEMKEKITKIEQLKFGNRQKAGLILVLLGEKPAVEVALYGWNDPPGKFAEVIKEIGLNFEELKFEGRSLTPPKLVTRFAIAQDKETVLKLRSLSPARDHREYGLLMGYPESAVMAFVEHKENPEKITKGSMAMTIMKERPVVNFALSKDNWQEEVKTAQRWNAAIKKHAPELYKEIQGIK